MGKIPLRRKWHPTPVFLPGESPWTEEPGSCSPWGCRESDMIEHTHVRQLAPLFDLEALGHGWPLGMGNE